MATPLLAQHSSLACLPPLRHLCEAPSRAPSSHPPPCSPPVCPNYGLFSGMSCYSCMASLSNCSYLSTAEFTFLANVFTSYFLWKNPSLPSTHREIWFKRKISLSVFLNQYHLLFGIAFGFFLFILFLFSASF